LRKLALSSHVDDNLHANLVINVKFEHGEGNDETRVHGTAISIPLTPRVTSELAPRLDASMRYLRMLGGWRMRSLTGWIVFIVITAACGGSSSTTVSGAAMGDEGGACYGNGTCNSGLACLSNVCVSTEAGSATDSGIGGDSSAPDAAGDAPVSEAGRRNDAGLACPGADIFHPGTETRNVGTSVPFSGRARDAECTPITGAKLVWTDSLEGQIGTGEIFSYTFTMTGTHTVTLTATDGSGNKYTAAVTFLIV